VTDAFRLQHGSRSSSNAFGAAVERVWDGIEINAIISREMQARCMTRLIGLRPKASAVIQVA
jgi:hypothetical protein